MNDIDQTARSVVDLITGTWRSRALYAAAKLAIPDLIAEGKTTAVTLAAAAGVDPDAISRLMRLLVRLGVFEDSGPGGYRLTPVGDLLRTDGTDSMRDLCLLYGEEFLTAAVENSP